MTQARQDTVRYIYTDDDQASLPDRLLSLLSARLIPQIEGWEFLGILAKQTIDPLPDDLELLVKQIEHDEHALQQAIAACQSPTQPLIRLIKYFKLTSFEINILLLALAPELDERFGDLYSHINGFPKERRLPLHKAHLLLLDKYSDRNQTRRLLTKSALWKAGILEYEQQTPLFERSLQVGEVLLGGVELDCILSSQEIVLHSPTRKRYKHDMAEARSTLLQQSRELAAWSEQQQQAVIIFKSEIPDIAMPNIGALANALHRPWFSFYITMDNTHSDLKKAILTSIMLDAIPVIHADTEKPFSFPQNIVPLLNGLLILLTKNQEITIPYDIPVRQINACPPKPLEQANLWYQHLHSTEHNIDIDLLANQNRIDDEQIKKAVNLAQNFASHEQARQLTKDHISRALREIIHEPASPFTTTEWPDVPWQSLVLNRQTMKQLESLVSRVHQRITVENRWDMISAKRGGATGLVALLHGESGTGKTFAAKAVATRLKLPMLRVDLSRIVSKYIGETEKNLAKVFNIAEGYRGLLFFDEADSLFGKRTGIKDAHDRHANLQVNFLLQRLEQFEGITLLASNFQQNMDTAFTRRISFSIHFPRPTPPQQLNIWKRQLPKVSLHESIDLNRVANTYDLVGGEIRNSALRAAYAAAANSTLITGECLEDAILQEFIKMGRPQPAKRIAGHRN